MVINDVVMGYLTVCYWAWPFSSLIYPYLLFDINEGTQKWMVYNGTSIYRRMISGYHYWKWHIEIVDLPIKDDDFPVRKLRVYQRVYLGNIWR